MLLQGVVVRLVCARVLWSWRAGAAAGCHERCQNAVPALELEGELQGRSRVLPESVVCALWSRPAGLQGAAAGCCLRVLSE